MRIRTLAAGLLAATALLAAAGSDAAPRALLIGVADVPHNALPGVDLDIDNMKKVAGIMGFRPGDIKILFNEQATYANVRQALGGWVKDGVQPQDRVLIYFSGHGTRVPDPSPGSAGGVDDALVLHDVQRVTVQGHASLRNVLIGHEFGAALAAIPSRNVLVLVDACHSGTATRTLALGNERLGVGSGVMKFFTYPGMPTAHTRALKMHTGDENYAALSAARDDEFAVGTEQGGLFTLGVAGAIEEASRDGKHPTVADLRTASAAFIATHTDEQSRHHPMTDGNEQLIRGELALIPLRDGQGPTWQALAALAAQAEPLTLSGTGHEVRLGEEITLEVAVPRPGYLNVVTVDSQDRATVLYPNKFATANDVKAGAFKFPTAEMNFVVRAAEPVGPSLVVAFLTDKRVSLLELGVEGRDAAGRMQQTFTEVSARATRALTVEARHSGFAAGTTTVTVKRAEN
ncbi:MAG TPA: caspase family protein [Steroidobacteraceae bacterium]|nr:caspase family protein [Steroidobacteraceae bacterium]